MSLTDTLAAAEEAGHRIIAVIVERDGSFPVRTRLLAGACDSFDLLSVVDAAAAEVAARAAPLTGPMGEIHRQAAELISTDVREAVGSLSRIVDDQAEGGIDG